MPIAHLLRAIAAAIDECHDAPGWEPLDPSEGSLDEGPDGFLSAFAELFDPVAPGDEPPAAEPSPAPECGRHAADAPWRRLYHAHRETDGAVPRAIVSACLDDIREAGVLHSVALIEIARKWGFAADA